MRPASWVHLQLAERQRQRLREATRAQWHPAPVYDPQSDPELLADEARYAARLARRRRSGSAEPHHASRCDLFRPQSSVLPLLLAPDPIHQAQEGGARRHASHDLMIE